MGMTVLGEDNRHSCIPFSVVAGVVALALQSDALRQNFKHKSRRRVGDMIGSVAELLWVLGNLIWMLEDVIIAEKNSIVWGAAVSLFAVGALLMIATLFFHRIDTKCTPTEMQLSPV